MFEVLPICNDSSRFLFCLGTQVALITVVPEHLISQPIVPWTVLVFVIQIGEKIVSKAHGNLGAQYQSSFTYQNDNAGHFDQVRCKTKAWNLN